MQPARAADPIPFAAAGNMPASCTGRARSVRRGGGVPADGSTADGPGRPTRSAATILVAGPDGGPSAGRAIAAAAGRGLRVLISSGLDDFLRYSLIKAAILPVCVDRETAAALQVAVESDPGILLTVDFGRHEVRARGFVARFEIGGGTENMAERLRIAQRLLGSAALPGDVRVRLQRRLAAICDALKVPGADAARGARRLDLLLADLARSSSAGLPGAARPGAARPYIRGPAPPGIPHSRSIVPSSGVDTPCYHADVIVPYRWIA